MGTSNGSEAQTVNSVEVFVRRAAELGLAIDASTAERIWAYFRLLEKWNARMNLTGFHVGPDNRAAIDRLLIEPMLAVRYAQPARMMVDAGSGGGSPAIPFALAATPSPMLTMVESRQRKATFLREALRETGLDGAVHAARFEDFAADASVAGTFDLVTVRAVRLDTVLLEAMSRVLRSGGQLLHLHEPGVVRDPGPRILWGTSAELLESTRSCITVGTRVH